MMRFLLHAGLCGLLLTGCTATGSTAKWEYLCLPASDLVDLSPLVDESAQNRMSQTEYDRRSDAIIKESTRAANDPTVTDEYKLGLEQQLTDLSAERQAGFDWMVARISTFADGASVKFTAELNRLGLEGWEMIQIVGGTNSTFYFKRQL